MMQLARTMPSIMTALHQLPFDYAEGEGIDFEPFPTFLSEAETSSWIQAWTGNKSLDGAEYRVFGQDGSGGYAAFWGVRPSGLLEQPIVFFGSEGNVGVVASGFADYLWLLAGGFGPFEAVTYSDMDRSPNPQFTTFAKTHAAANQATPAEILTKTRSELPTFKEDIQVLCG